MTDLLVTYDVDTTTPEGRTRLRNVAKLCEAHGIRVQKSVFEIIADDKTLLLLMDRIDKIIAADLDSIRIYRLPRNGFANVTVRGTATLTPHHTTHIL